LLPLRDARSANAFAFFIDSQQRMSEVVGREFGGSIRRGKGPLRL
jgi:hypothetical protein